MLIKETVAFTAILVYFCLSERETNKDTQNFLFLNIITMSLGLVHVSCQAKPLFIGSRLFGIKLHGFLTICLQWTFITVYFRNYDFITCICIGTTPVSIF